VIWDKAEELGRLIGQTPEYKAMRRSEATLRRTRRRRPRSSSSRNWLARWTSWWLAARCRTRLPPRPMSRPYGSSRSVRADRHTRGAGQLREGDDPGQPDDRARHGEGRDEQHHYARMTRGCWSRWRALKGGKIHPRPRSPGPTRGGGGSRPGGFASPAGRTRRKRSDGFCSSLATTSNRQVNCFSFLRPAPTWCEGHPAGSRGGYLVLADRYELSTEAYQCGTGAGPRSLPDRESGGDRGTLAGPHPRSRRSCRGGTGARAEGGEAAGQDRGGRDGVPRESRAGVPRGAWSGLVHLDASRDPAEVAGEAWEALRSRVAAP